MALMRAKKRRRGSRVEGSPAWWQQPENWAVIAMAAVGLLLVVVMVWRQTPPEADVDQAAIAAAEAGDPRMREIEARFRCPCGNCGHLELADCACEVPGGALEMKTSIARLLSEGQGENEVIAAIAGRFGGLKPEGTGTESSPQGQTAVKDFEGDDTAVNLHSSHREPAAPEAVMRVASVFDCPCGNCVLTLVDCTCDHANGAVEVKAYINDRLSAGLSEADVIEAVAQAFGAQRRQVASTATGVLSNQ